MTRLYDLVIVGTGTVAMVAAMRVRAAGWSVAKWQSHFQSTRRI
jgi:glutathione reductase (NADPH)